MKSISEDIIKESCSMNDICKKIYGYCNGRTIKKIKEFIKVNNIDTTHFFNKNTKYEIVKKVCPVCGKDFETKKNKTEKTTCSISCSNTYFRSGKSDEEKEKISNSLKKFYKTITNEKNVPIANCVICEKEFMKKKTKSGVYSRAKTCSSKCRKKLQSNHSKKLMKKLIKEGKHKGWMSRNKKSYPEKFFEAVLKNNNLLEDCLMEYKIPQKELGLNNSYNYFIDFFFPNKKICLEIDGKQHQLKDRKISDQIRDKLLSKNGYKIYRIKWKSINTKNGNKYIKNEIDKFLMYYEKNNIINYYNTY
jgi:very-short-patch-repair endonuclease